MKKVLILNGSPQGRQGNCQKLIRRIQKEMKNRAEAQVLILADVAASKAFRSQLKDVDAVIFVTGTYWDSWGSPLQRFLEGITDMEGASEIVGKPCAIFVLMHSVGGKSVLSRLQGVLSTFGFLIPPMSGLVYSLASDLAIKAHSAKRTEDFWNLKDLNLILSNLLQAVEIQLPWKTWPVDDRNFRKIWLK